MLNEVKPTYFLLENVVMKKEWEDIITKELGVEPIKINSSLVSAQNRVRLYWTNIPGVGIPEDRGITLNDVLEIDSNDNPGAFRGRQLNKATILGRRLNELGVRQDYNTKIPYTQCLEVRASNMGKSNCLTTVDKDNVLTPLPIGRYPNAFKDKLSFRYYSLLEYERLQTIPEGYTNVVSTSKAKKMIGNGWTVDVIAHIFSFIK
jgi:DNA (cytosine-5)-methyltransferase 3A